MAESTLTLGFLDLKKAVGFYLSYGIVPGSWGTTKTAEIEGIVQSGYRRVLYPSCLPNVLAHNWSFLRPSDTLDLVADQGDYDLPNDFGQLVGKFHYAADQHRIPIRHVSEGAILDMRSVRDYNQYPNFVAIRFKSSDGSAGQRSEALFYPEPDADYTVSYNYDAYQGVLSDTYPYPLGGMQMSEVYKESCLAVAEIQNGDEYGLHNRLCERLLLDAIARDKKRGATTFGQMGQPSGTIEGMYRRGSKLYEGSYEITYKGSYI